MHIFLSIVQLRSLFSILVTLPACQQRVRWARRRQGETARVEDQVVRAVPRGRRGDTPRDHRRRGCNGEQRRSCDAEGRKRREQVGNMCSRTECLIGVVKYIYV
jgi:hypothetical protein